MPVNKKYLAVFEFDKIFHIYNATNNKEPLFLSAENYYYFLRQFDFYISPIAETFAWNLLPNHFHFLIRIKSLPLIKAWIRDIPSEKQTKTELHFLSDNNVNALIEMEFKRLFTSYAMAFNKMHKRRGNLFSRTFKRVNILKDSQFTQVLIYIHANAQKHKIVDNFLHHKWSSYHSIISDKTTKILRDEVLNWFGGIDQFKKVHREMSDHFYDFSGRIEDDAD
jgi:REP element-mobilizing transposase RayT